MLVVRATTVQEVFKLHVQLELSQLLQQLLHPLPVALVRLVLGQ